MVEGVFEMTLRERYEKETGEPAIENIDCMFVASEGYVLWLESQLEPKDKLKYFKDTEWTDFETFTDHMSKEHGWDRNKSGYYYQAMLDWSNGITSKGQRKRKMRDWILVALNWEKKDKKNGTGYYKNNREAVRF